MVPGPHVIVRDGDGFGRLVRSLHVISRPIGAGPLSAAGIDGGVEGGGPEHEQPAAITTMNIEISRRMATVWRWRCAIASTRVPGAYAP